MEVSTKGLFPSAGNVQIMPMTKKHLKDVIRIEQQEYVQPWTSTLFVSEMAQRTTRRYTVALAEKVVIGYTGLMLIDEEGHVNTLTVDGAWQRRGVASLLLLDLARAAVKAGARHLTLEVREHNEAAKALYMRFGFAPVGIRKNYYAETSEDAIIMWARDIDNGEYKARLAKIEAGIGARLGW
jgi:ribosomal-protein-alanine N-acetyltransferase